MHPHQTFIGVLVWSSVLSLCACAPLETLRIPDAIGPEPVSGIPEGSMLDEGFLVVYTDTYRVDRGLQDVYHPHNPYELSDLRGNLLRRVTNHTSEEDESPMQISVLHGNYIVRGLGLRKMMEVTVRVEGGQTTFVYLDRSWAPPRAAPPEALVRAPDGTPLGWNARARAVLGMEEELLYEGSSTIAAFVRDARGVYKKHGISIDDSGESEAGEAAALAAADIGGVAREVSQPPQGIKCTIIGYDAIVAIVRADAPIEGVTMEQLAGIFSGRLKNWEQVGGPNRPIRPLIAAHGSATRVVFRKIVLKDAEYDALVVRPDRDIIERVARSHAMIGQISMAMLLGEDRVRALAIDGQPPLPDNSDYPIIRPLNLCLRSVDAPEEARDFLAWTMSDEGQQVLRRRFVGVGE